MNAIRITYDPEGDILSVTFGEPVGATGHQLSDQVLLRIDPETGKAAGLTIFNYSIHNQSAQDVPLPGLKDDPEVRRHLMSVLTSTPVSHFLQVIEIDRSVKATLLSPTLHEAVAE